MKNPKNSAKVRVLEDQSIAHVSTLGPGDALFKKEYVFVDLLFSFAVTFSPWGELLKQKVCKPSSFWGILTCS